MTAIINRALANIKQDDINTFRNLLSAQELIFMYYVQHDPDWFSGYSRSIQFPGTEQCCENTG